MTTSTALVTQLSYISPISPLYLPHISPVSPLYLRNDLATLDEENLRARQPLTRNP